MENYKVNFLNLLFPDFNIFLDSDIINIDSKFLQNFSNVLNILNIKHFKIIENRKRNRYQDLETFSTYFDNKNWFSPSRIRLAIDEPFKILIKEKNINIKDSNDLELLFSQGEKYEKYILNEVFLKNKVNVRKICDLIPNVKDIKKMWETYESLMNGDEVIYQGLLIDGESKMWGSPDFLVRLDVFKRLFKKNSDLYNFDIIEIKNNFGNLFYVVIDVKFSTCNLLKNGYLNNEKKSLLNKIQVFIYQFILNKIQGKIPNYNFGFICGLKIKDNHTISVGYEKLAPINFNNSEFDNYLLKVNNAINLIKKIRSNTFDKLIENEEYKPKRIKDEYKDLRESILGEDSSSLKINKKNIKKLLNLFDNKLLIYFDIETINKTLVSEPEEIIDDIKEGKSNTIIYQIGMYYNLMGTEYYESYFSESLESKDIKYNFLKFTYKINELSKMSGEEVILLCWGNYEIINYRNLSSEIRLNKLNIIDLLKLIKENEIFSNTSLSLKSLIKDLNKVDNKIFNESYSNCDIDSGLKASIEGYNYYQEEVKNRKEIREEIEKYNKIDCEILYKIVYWMKKNKLD